MKIMINGEPGIHEQWPVVSHGARAIVFFFSSPPPRKERQSVRTYGHCAAFGLLAFKFFFYTYLPLSLFL